MEVKLTDNSKLTLTRLADDRLRLDLYQPKTLRDGHGYTWVGSAVLDREPLEMVLRESVIAGDTPAFLATRRRGTGHERTQEGEPAHDRETHDCPME